MIRLAALAGLALASSAAAQEREYCPSRPGLGTTPCTIAPGKVSLETAIADWQRDDQPGWRTDTLAIGDSEVRVGLSDSSEAVIAWTPYARVRTSDAVGLVERSAGVGDVVLGFKQNLAHPDGSEFSLAVQPFVTLPVGRKDVGAGDWGAGLLVPMSYDLSDAINLQATPQIDAAVDESGHGRHLAYSAIAGIGVKLAASVDLVAEIEARADDDPAGHTRSASAALSLAWTPADDLQLDVGGVAGLNSDAPDVRLYAGISRQF